MVSCGRCSRSCVSTAGHGSGGRVWLTTTPHHSRPTASSCTPSCSRPTMSRPTTRGSPTTPCGRCTTTRSVSPATTEWQWEAYVRVNRRFARSVARRSHHRTTTGVDSRLSPAARAADAPRQRADVRIGFFNHIPFPPYELFARIPWREEIMKAARRRSARVPAPTRRAEPHCRREATAPRPDRGHRRTLQRPRHRTSARSRSRSTSRSSRRSRPGVQHAGERRPSRPVWATRR